MTPLVGARVVNHSKDVIEETYDPWEYFDEKRDALERLENYLLQLRADETANVAGKAKRLRLVAVYRAGSWRLGKRLLIALHASLYERRWFTNGPAPLSARRDN